MHADVNGTTLYYEVHGEGRPLLILHGGLGLDHAYLRPWLDRLAGEASLIYYDHRGNGRSERPASLEGVTHATWAEDADALRAHLGHERVVVLGHSYGGFLAQELALRHGDRLAGLILCDTAPVVDYLPVVQAAVRRRGLPEAAAAFDAAFHQPMAGDDDWRRIWMGLLPLYLHAPVEPAALADIDARTRYSAAAWQYANACCLGSFNTLPRLGEICAPTLILGGAHDIITPVPQGAERLHAGIPGSELVVFKESGHFPFIEEPEAFTDVVRGWLSRLPRSAGQAGTP